ncbi:MAG: type IV toxin-antitoxin system AbiEi family antitoxin [Acidobacteriota bacterium]
MKSANAPPKARQYIEHLVEGGQYSFTSREARLWLRVSDNASKLALNRMAKRRLIASPARGFYVIVPPEYRSLGSPPADQFIPALMEHLELPYYVGLLSAAQYYGAAHQRPQEFQVFIDKKRRPITCGMVRVSFIVRKRARDVPVQTFNTPRGTLRVSTPEATALDLVGYQHHAGGLDLVSTVLTELAERIDSNKLPTAAVSAPIAWSQRLGYLLERVGAGAKASGLRPYVRTHAEEWTALLPKGSLQNALRNEDWKVYVNAEVETDL